MKENTRAAGNSQVKTIVRISVPLIVLVALTSCIGIFVPDFYHKETLNWQTQSLGQDILNLVLIVPGLIVVTFLTFSNRRIATLLWGGVLLYLVYTFVIYCFDVHFNRLFIAYCLGLGLSFYSFIYFLYTQINERIATDFGNALVIKVIGIYFLVLSTLFYLLWLGEIIPAITNNTTPKSLLDVGLPTNPVHIIDLSVILPGIFTTGIFLLKKKRIGFILAPVILVFFILMDITIGFLIVMMKEKGLPVNLWLTSVMGMLALFSLVLLIGYLRSLNKNGIK